MQGFIEKIADFLMFREGTEEDEEGALQPVVTTGSIVWGILLRSAIIVVISFLIIEITGQRNWWITFIVWLFAIYPAFRQFNIFQERIKKVEEETLCGSCKHFDATSQLCKIYDEHITKSYIPCDGLNWEPLSYEDKKNVN